MPPNFFCQYRIIFQSAAGTIHSDVQMILQLYLVMYTMEQEKKKGFVCLFAF